VREPTLRPGRLLAAVVVLRMLTTAAAAADLQPRTVAAFDRYVRATEAQMVPDPFLRIDGFSDVERRAKLAELSRGELNIERLSTREAGKPIEVPDGLIHHWLGAVFMPWRTSVRRWICSRIRTVTPKSSVPPSRVRNSSRATATCFVSTCGSI
jgi:hypothetical protein